MRLAKSFTQMLNASMKYAGFIHRKTAGNENTRAGNIFSLHFCFLFVNWGFSITICVFCYIRLKIGGIYFTVIVNNKKWIIMMVLDTLKNFALRNFVFLRKYYFVERICLKCFLLGCSMVTRTPNISGFTMI